MPSRLFFQIDNSYRNGSYYVIEGGGDLYKRGFTTPLLKCLTKGSGQVHDERDA